MAASSAAAQQRRLASLQQRQQPPQDEPPIGAAVSFGAVTVHSAALLAEICGEPEPEPEPEPLPGPRHGAGGSVSVNVDTLVCALHLVLGLALSVALARLLARGRPPGCRARMLADLDAAVCAGRAAAAASGQSELLDILVGSGARLDDTDAAGDTALIAAAKHGQRACVELLLEGGADVNAPNALGNWTPLHAAAYEQHAAVVMLLMERGADPGVTDGEGRTAADYASLSEGVWPLFEARGCRRLTHPQLVERGVLKVAPQSVLHIDGESAAGGRGGRDTDGVPRPGSGRFTVRPPWRPVTRAGVPHAAGSQQPDAHEPPTVDVLAGEAG
jgi:hypothetical protein